MKPAADQRLAASACSILVVDDSEDHQILLSLTLNAEGYGTLSACHGKEALEILYALSLENRLPGAILLDLMMPEMDGFEFRRRQLNSPGFAHIPVIVMTASEFSSQELEVLSPAAFHRKPLRVEQLIATLRRVAHIPLKLAHYAGVPGPTFHNPDRTRSASSPPKLE